MWGCIVDVISVCDIYIWRMGGGCVYVAGYTVDVLFVCYGCGKNGVWVICAGIFHTESALH